MDTTALVNKLKTLFLNEKSKGLLVDAIGLAPAYGGLVSDSFVLGVSAPSMAMIDCYDKMDIIIDLLFANLNEAERRMIDRVRVYDSINELKSHAENDFDESSCACERPLQLNAALYEMA